MLPSQAWSVVDMEVLRVLLVRLVIDGLGRGGAERSLSELVPVLCQRGVDPLISVFQPSPSDGVGSDLAETGFEVEVLRGANLPAQIKALRASLRERPPDLVHATLVKSGIASRLAAWGTVTPVLTSLVNATYEAEHRSDPRVSRTKLWTVQCVDGWTARHLTAHFHAITHAVKDSAVRTLGLQPSMISVVERGRDVVRLGAPSKARRQRVRARLGIAQDTELVLNVGRQEYQKGQSTLLAAFDKISHSRPRARLLIAGRDGSASAELRKYVAATALQDRVLFLGHRNDVPDLLAAADVFVFPSFFEGLGGAVIEAMALECPIVASDIPPLREIITDEETGVLVPPRNAALLSTAIEATLADRQESRRLGVAARRAFLARFTLERSAERMLALYHRVATIGRDNADPRF